MQQSNTKPLQQTYHTTQTHLKSYVFLLCSFCWILPRGICIRCYNLLVAKYVTRPFVFSENPTQSLHQQSRSVHQFAVYSNNPCCKLVSIQKMSPWTARCGSHQCHLLIPFASNVQELLSLSFGSSSADMTRRKKEQGASICYHISLPVFLPARVIHTDLFVASPLSNRKPTRPMVLCTRLWRRGWKHAIWNFNAPWPKLLFPHKILTN